MKKFKRTIYVSTVWNILLFVALFFQGRIILDEVNKQLYPTNEFLAPLFEGTIVEFIEKRFTNVAIFIAIFVIVQLVIFFFVNIIISKNLKKADIDDNSYNKKGIIRFYKYLNRYMIGIILVFVIIVAFYALKLYNIYNSIDVNLIDKTINDVYNLVLSSQLEILFNFSNIVNKILELISSNADINNIYTTAMNAYNFLLRFKDFWFILSNIVLVYGLYENILCLNFIRKGTKSKSINE